MTVLAAGDAYRLWAPGYEGETAISQLERETVDALGVATAGRALLDVGCGTSRRMHDSDAAMAVGIDLSIDMLRRASMPELVTAGDMRALPFASDSFDVVWCRLAIGHVRALDLVYGELSRVCRPAGVVVVSDLNPDAAAAGHRRTFRDQNGAMHEVEHFVHAMTAHSAAARATGLELTQRRDGVVGASIRRFYADADRLPAYEKQHGSPIVLVLAWKKQNAGR